MMVDADIVVIFEVDAAQSYCVVVVGRDGSCDGGGGSSSSSRVMMVAVLVRREGARMNLYLVDGSSYFSKEYFAGIFSGL